MAQINVFGKKFKTQKLADKWLQGQINQLEFKKKKGETSKPKVGTTTFQSIDSALKFLKKKQGISKTKSTGGSSVSGSNAGVPVPKTKESGDSYNEVLGKFKAATKSSQTFVDPNGLAAWGIKNGFNPDFGSEEWLQRHFTPGSNIFAGATPEDQSAYQAWQAGTPVDPKTLSADELVDKAFTEDLGGDLFNLQNNEWWKKADLSEREQAFQKIQEIMTTPEKLSDYVAEKGLTKLQDFKWWSESPHKQAAWDLIQQKAPAVADAGADTSGIVDATGVTDPAATDTAGTTDPSVGGTDATDGISTDQAKRQEVVSYLTSQLDAGAINQNTFDLFMRTYDVYGGDDPIDTETILSKFNQIKGETLDPRFAEEIKFFEDNLKFQVQQIQATRERELEAQGFNAGESIRQAKAGLEKAGMTFTGKGIEQLGAQSAFAQPGAAGVATPFQTPFGGLFNEGTVNQQNRLLASGSQAAFQQQLGQLGAKAEAALGAQSVGLVPGAPASGLTKGSIQTGQEQQLGNVLTGLINNKSQQIQQQQPVQTFKQ